MQAIAAVRDHCFLNICSLVDLTALLGKNLRGGTRLALFKETAERSLPDVQSTPVLLRMQASSESAADAEKSKAETANLQKRLLDSESVVEDLRRKLADSESAGQESCVCCFQVFVSGLGSASVRSGRELVMKSPGCSPGNWWAPRMLPGIIKT